MPGTPSGSAISRSESGRREDALSDRRSLPYWVRFGALVVASLGVLLAIVFAVFPQRFVLAPGLREQGLNFPAEAPEFELPTLSGLARPEPPDEEATPPTGPEERLWARVTPLVEMGRDELAIREMRAWLDDRPADHDVRLEYARALERSGRLAEAEDAYERVLEERGDDADRQTRLALARLRWRTGDLEGALPLYDGMIDDRPADRAVRRERADLLLALGRHREAADEYRALLAEAPEGAAPDELRLALSRALHAAGATVPAWRALAEVPPDGPEAGDAAELRALLRAEMPLPAADTAPAPALARARSAAAAGDLERAERLYRTAVFLRPGDETRRLELAELLAARRGAPAEAVAVLESLGRRTSAAGAGPFAGSDARPSAELRRRLVRYRLWSGDDDGALALLRELAAEEEATADDLALAADILRWRGRRPEAEARYVDALAQEVDHDRARKGRSLLREETRREVEARDPAAAGVESDLYVDSDDFRSWGVAGRAVLDPGWDTHRLVARAGVRSVRGPSTAGPLEEEVGPEGHVGWIGWWRQATLRTALRVGAERLETTGTEPVVEAELALPRLGLETAYRHGLAHPTTLTLASVRDRTRIDRVEASLFRPLADDWGLWTSVEGASVRGGGVDNGRFVAQAALDRPVGLDGRLRAGYATRMLTTTEPAPVTGGGAEAYWSPALSWTHGLSLELERPRDETGWGWRARVQPGASMVRLHGDDAGTELEFALFGEGGLEYRTGDASLRLGAEYVRSRLDGYEALGANLGVSWRF